MSPLSPSPPKQESCFPRVSGDEPYALTEAEYLAQFSPRERG